MPSAEWLALKSLIDVRDVPSRRSLARLTRKLVYRLHRLGWREQAHLAGAFRVKHKGPGPVWAFRYCGRHIVERSSLMLFVSRQELPYTEPYVR